MSAVPQSLREGAFGLGASKLQTTMRVVFPAALSGIVASVVLGFSRAVGETMVVVIAAGLQPQWGAQPFKPMETMTAFIAGHGQGRHRHRQHRLQDHLRGRDHAVRDHADHEPDLDPFRSQVPAGVRVSTLDTPAPMRDQRVGLAGAQRTAASGWRCSPASASRSCCWASSWYDIVADGAGRPHAGLHHQLLVDQRRPVGDPGGALGHDLAHGRLRAVHRSGGRRHRDLPRGVRRQRPSGTTALIEVNIQNLAAVPSIVYGILGLAFLVRGPLSLGPVVLAGGLTLGLLVLPVVIIAGREAIRAVPPSIREGSMALGATQWQTIWKQVLPAADAGHRHRRDPGPVARHRRDGSADRRRRRHLHRLQPRGPRLATSPRCRSRSSTGSPGRRTTSTTTVRSQPPGSCC